MTDFYTVFSTVFAVLGLKLLFGNHTVSIGSVVLLTYVSAAAASAWTGGAGEWLGSRFASFANATLASNADLLVASSGPVAAFAQDALGRLLGSFPEHEVDSL